MRHTVQCASTQDNFLAEAILSIIGDVMRKIVVKTSEKETVKPYSFNSPGTKSFNVTGTNKSGPGATGSGPLITATVFCNSLAAMLIGLKGHEFLTHATLMAAYVTADLARKVCPLHSLVTV